MSSMKKEEQKICDEILARRRKESKLHRLRTVYKYFFGDRHVDYPNVLKWYLTTQKSLNPDQCALRKDMNIPALDTQESLTTPGFSLNYVNDILASPFILRRIDAIDEVDKIILPPQMYSLKFKKRFLDSLEDDTMGWQFIEKRVYPYKLPHSKFYMKHVFDSTRRWQRVVDRGDMVRYLVRQIRRVERKYIKQAKLEVQPMAALRYHSPFHIQELEICQDYNRDRKICPKFMNMAYIRRDMDTIRDENFLEITPCMYAAFKRFKKLMIDMIHPTLIYYNELWLLFHNNLCAKMDQICDPITPIRVNVLIKEFGKYVEYVKNITNELKCALDAEKCSLVGSKVTDKRLASKENLIKKLEEKGVNIPGLLEYPYCNYCRYGYRVSECHDEDKPNCHKIHLEAPCLRAFCKPGETCHLPPSSEENEYLDPCDKKCSPVESDSGNQETEGHGLCVEIAVQRPKFKDGMQTIYVSNDFWQFLRPTGVVQCCSLDDADTLSEICKLKRALEPQTCIDDCECGTCREYSQGERRIRRRILGLKPLSKKKAIETKMIHSLITGNIGKTNKEEDLFTDNILKGNLREHTTLDPLINYLGKKYVVNLDDLTFNELLVVLLGQWIDLGIFGKKLPLVRVNKPVQSFPLFREQTGEEQQQPELGEGEEEEGIQIKQYMIPFVEFIVKEVMGNDEPGEVLKAVVKKHLRRSNEKVKKDLAMKNLSFSMDYLLKPFTYKNGVLTENPKLWKTCNKGKPYKKEDEIKELGEYLLVNLIKSQLNEVPINREDEKCDAEVVDFAECLLNIFNEYFSEEEFYHYDDDEEKLFESPKEELILDAKTRCQDENKVFESLINCLINHLPVKDILTEVFGSYRERTRRFELIQAFKEDKDPEFCNLVAPIIRELQGLEEKSDEDIEEKEKKEKDEGGEKKRKMKKIRTKEWTGLIQVAQDIEVRSKTLLSQIRLFKVEQLLDYSHAHKEYKLDCDLVQKMLNHSKEINDILGNVKTILTRLKIFSKILLTIETRTVKIGLSQFLSNLVEQEKEKSITLKEVTNLLTTKLRSTMKYINRYQGRNDHKGFNMYRFIYYLDNTKDDIQGIHTAIQLVIENLVHNVQLNMPLLKQILETKAPAIETRQKFELIPGYGKDFESEKVDYEEKGPVGESRREKVGESGYAIGEWYRSKKETRTRKTLTRKSEEETITTKKLPKRRRKPVFWNDMLLFMSKVRYRIKNMDDEQSAGSTNNDVTSQPITSDRNTTSNSYESSKNKKYGKKHILTRLTVKRSISLDKNNNYKEELSKKLIKQETADKKVTTTKSTVTSKYSGLSRLYSPSDSDENPFEEYPCKELGTQLKHERRKRQFECEMKRYCCNLMR